MPHGLKRLNLSVGACFRIVDGFAEVGFDVDVGNGGLPILFFQCVFDAIGNFVGFNDGQVRIYFDVEVEDVDVSVLRVRNDDMPGRRPLARLRRQFLS